jgi:hypothetical protein
MLDACPNTPIGLRDRALLSLGYAGAFRPSELVALKVRDVEEVPDQLRVTIRRSKTDRTGEGTGDRHSQRAQDPPSGRARFIRGCCHSGNAFQPAMIRTHSGASGSITLGAYENGWAAGDPTGGTATRASLP